VRVHFLATSGEMIKPLAATATLGAVGWLAYRAICARKSALPAGSKKVYCFPPSTCSRRVLATLLELGLRKDRDFEVVSVNTVGQNKAPEHLSRQPFGRVPVWEEGEWQLFESRAICAHLARTYGGSCGGNSLLPCTPRQLAKMDQWISVEVCELYPSVMKVYKEKVLKPRKGLGDPDPAVVAEGIEGLQKPLDVMEAHLAISSYLASDAFSLADLGYLPYLQALCDAGEASLLKSRPNLFSWWERCSSRPAWCETVAMAAEYIPAKKVGGC